MASKEIMTVQNWELPGSQGRPIRGTTHVPEGDARSVVIIVHGYLGYKDYGMFPWIASHLCKQGHIVHRINLSHSGMDHGHGVFDLESLAKDTWNRGVEDLTILMHAVQKGTRAGQGRGVVLLGHSRGGSTALLAAGRHGGEEDWGSLVGVISLAAPAALRRMSKEDEHTLIGGGTLTLSSSRTEQTWEVGLGWLQEQIDDPQSHDLCAQVSEIGCPIGLLHGAEDATVDPADAITLAQANPTRALVRLVAGGDHVFNTPNPFAMEASPSPQLAEACEMMTQWLDTWVQ